MNYLAHAALSNNIPDVIFGNIIGDHVRGPDLTRYPDNIATGIKLHRAIDSFFDEHTKVRAIRERFPQGTRRYAGIVIDFWFDHLLANRWTHFYSQPLSQFQTVINKTIKSQWTWVPATQKRFFDYLIAESLFIRYQKEKHINNNVQLVSKRLKHSEKLIEALEELKKHQNFIATNFDAVYFEMLSFSDTFIKKTIDTQSL
ncbi:ACP phosphodiesterase [Pleionea sediminis]|uniref:acyl carrier protein phosphodiesterase n=1 Tax=Pleionea sediminis TaxID=2569479 RepID=UPI00118663EB|nr:ACP phosphodiesterase [Pleionea sediminis]